MAKVDAPTKSLDIVIVESACKTFRFDHTLGCPADNATHNKRLWGRPGAWVMKGFCSILEVQLRPKPATRYVAFLFVPYYSHLARCIHTETKRRDNLDSIQPLEQTTASTIQPLDPKSACQRNRNPACILLGRKERRLRN